MTDETADPRAVDSLRQAFLLTVIILAVEFGAGLVSGSLALLSDAGHILTDVVALGLAWFAVNQSKRPADARRTYGYQRVGILTAMANGVTLILIVIAIGYEAIQRFLHPHPVNAALVIGAALLAIAVNTYIARKLQGGRKNLNIAAALLHVVGDLGASLGVIVAGAVILLTGWLYIDPLISVGIAALIAWGALRIVLDTVNILLEGVPKEMDLRKVRDRLESTRGVESVHDLHVWSVSPEQVAMSAHVVVPLQRLSDAEHLVRELEQKVCDQFGIVHTTIQVEACHPCDADGAHNPGQHNHPHPD